MRRLGWISDYGMLVVLLVLCGVLALLTWTDQPANTPAGARQLAARLARELAPKDGVLIVARDHDADREFADALEQALNDGGLRVVGRVHGEPTDARKAIERLAADGEAIARIAGNDVTASWGVFENLGERFPALAETRVIKPDATRGSNFLRADNLRNVANQITVIGVIAVGMTLVIISGGIDLSVGSLIALSAVVTARLLRDYFGGESAGVGGMVLASFLAVLLCAAIGLATGGLVTLMRLPPFIATLAVMHAVEGAAYKISPESILDVPESYKALGHGVAWGGIPNAVLLMLLLYGLAHVLMTRMTPGRYLYAAGGNPEAARLSGVPVRGVLLSSYVACAALAGLGGLMLVSQFKSGSPTYGKGYELSVIAAVVVGGTSLAGGEGKILGTLIGALTIGVIHNGMNLLAIDSHRQKIVLGFVILAAVLLDQLRRRRSGGGSP